MISARSNGVHDYHVNTSLILQKQRFHTDYPLHSMACSANIWHPKIGIKTIFSMN